MRALLIGVVVCTATACGGQSGGLGPAQPTCEGALRDQGVVMPNVAPNGFSTSFDGAMATVKGMHQVTFATCTALDCNSSGAALPGTTMTFDVAVTGPARALRPQPEPYLPPDCPMAYEAPVALAINTSSLQTTMIGTVRVTLKNPIEVFFLASAPHAQVAAQFPADFSGVNQRHAGLAPDALAASTSLRFVGLSILADPAASTPTITGNLSWIFGLKSEAETVAPFASSAAR